MPQLGQTWHALTVCVEIGLKLWQSYKLADHTYEEYMYLCRDGVPARKRNFDEHKKWQDARALTQQVDERTALLRSSPALYQAFEPAVEADEWLGLIKVEALRYPLLLAHAPSHTGKTEWACSLFHWPLKVLVGTSTVFPDALRSLDRTVHDGLVLGDVRDLACFKHAPREAPGELQLRCGIRVHAGRPVLLQQGPLGAANRCDGQQCHHQLAALED